MNECKKIIILPNTKIHEAIEIIDRNSLQIAVVANEDGKLLGTVTDGDVRRGILKGISLDRPVCEIMNPHPVTIPILNDRNSILNILKANNMGIYSYIYEYISMVKNVLVRFRDKYIYT